MKQNHKTQESPAGGPPARLQDMPAKSGEDLAAYMQRLGHEIAKHAPQAVATPAAAIAALADGSQDARTGAPWDDVHTAMKELARALMEHAPQAVADAHAEKTETLLQWGELKRPSLRLLTCRLTDAAALRGSYPCRPYKAARRGDIGRAMACAAAAPLPVAFDRYGDRASNENTLAAWLAMARNYFDVLAALIAARASDNACHAAHGITICGTLEALAALQDIAEGALWEAIELGNARTAADTAHTA